VYVKTAVGYDLPSNADRPAKIRARDPRRPPETAKFRSSISKIPHDDLGDASSVPATRRAISPAGGSPGASSPGQILRADEEHLASCFAASGFREPERRLAVAQVGMTGRLRGDDTPAAAPTPGVAEKLPERSPSCTSGPPQAFRIGNVTGGGVVPGRQSGRNRAVLESLAALSLSLWRTTQRR
jgi:hypothetical protein